MGRRYKSLHHNLQDGENVVFHREHRSKRNRKRKDKLSLYRLRLKIEKKYGDDAVFVEI